MKHGPSLRGWGPSFALLTLTAVSSAWAAEASLGLEVGTLAEACALSSAAGADQDHDFQTVIPLSSDDLDPEAAWLVGAECDPSTLRGLIPLLDPPVSWQEELDPYAAVTPWLQRLEALLQARPELARMVQLGSRPDRRFSPSSYAFLAEKVSTLIRSIDPQAELLMGSVGDGAEEWFDTLDAARLAPYVHGLTLEEPCDLDAWSGRIARSFPAASVWLHTQDAIQEPEAWLKRVGQARAMRMRCVVARGPEGSPLRDLVLSLTRTLPSRLIPDTGPSGVQSIGGAPLMELMDPLGPEKLAVLGAGPERRLSVGPGPLKQWSVTDLVSGETIPATSVRPPRDATALWVDLPATDHMMLLRYVPVQEPHAASETVGVTEERELTAEEIVAGLRAHEVGQDRALDHYRATATISYHYRAEALNESVDVTSVNRFYWKERVGEYEETSLYVNGARWKGQAPALPFVSPETVKEVPLEIRLDQSYSYTLKGRAEVNGQPAWKLEFEPVDQAAALYSGAIWVHRESFARLRIQLVQHALKDPITSNMDEIEYAPFSVEGVDRELWLPVHGYRQMVFTVIGRTVSVERRVTYADFAINADGFEESRNMAYASGAPILREDTSGHSVRVRRPDGTWVVQADSLKNVALFGGMGTSTDGDLGLPFAGLNYFDFNFRGTGTQVDVAYAGVVLDASWTDPGLGNSDWELTTEARVSAYPDRFKMVDGEGRRREEDLEVLEQTFQTTFAHPLTRFSKGEARVDLGYDNYGAMDDTDPGFVLPPTRPVAVLTGRWRHHRWGFSTDAWASSGQRFGWKDWGLAGSEMPGASGTEDEDSFQRWGLTLIKALYPASLHKVSLAVSWQDGHDLDRFSRYRIGDFRNARVRGYNSYDVTFDRGVTTQASWLFTLPRTGISLDLSVEGAVIENDEEFEGQAWLSGGGAAISWGGPWGTLLSVRSGFGLGSSLDLGSSGASIRFIMIKTWDHWPWGSGADGQPPPSSAPSGPDTGFPDDEP